MNVYTNDSTMKQIILDLLPGCSLTDNAMEYDLALINNDHTFLAYNFKNMYSYSAKNLSNDLYTKILLNKIRLVANKYNQEYVSDLTDEIIGM